MDGYTWIGEALIVIGLVEIWFSYILFSGHGLLYFILSSLVGIALLCVGNYLIIKNLNPAEFDRFLNKFKK